MSEDKKSIEGFHLKTGMELPRRSKVTNEMKSKELAKKVSVVKKGKK